MLKKDATENAEGLSNVNETLSEVPEDQVSPPQNDSKFLMREDKNVLAEKETGEQLVDSVFTGEEEIADEETIPKPTVCVHKYGSKRFLCTKCGEKSYTNKGSLKRHLHYECGKASTYVCSVCGKAFHHKANYQRHAHVVHDIDGSKVKPGPGVKPNFQSCNTYGFKRFLCTKCGEKSYTNKGSLKRHLLVECGKASEYVCPVCGKAFHRKANYQRHAHVVHDIDGSKVGTGSKALYLCMR